MRDKVFKGCASPIKKIHSFDIEIPDDITDEIDKTLTEIEDYLYHISNQEILSDKKKKLISRISRWKYSFR
jgi:ribosome-associated translation inhibitor RaiA